MSVHILGKKSPISVSGSMNELDGSLTEVLDEMTIQGAPPDGVDMV